MFDDASFKRKNNFCLLSILETAENRYGTRKAIYTEMVPDGTMMLVNGSG
jgi:hypothetical protein